MLKARKGFTLIELLIVVVIIGILAAIAIPKFSKTREKAYFSAMKSDLKNLQSAQEIYYSSPGNNYTYASTLAQLGYTASNGVTVTIGASTNTGWGATSIHAALASGTQSCGVFVGDSAAMANATPATAPGVVACRGEN